MADGAEVGSYNSSGVAEENLDESTRESMPKLGLILAVGSAFLTSVAYVITQRTQFSSRMNLVLLEHSIHAIIVIPYISKIRNNIEISRSFWKFISLAGLLSTIASLLALYSPYVTPFSDEMFITHNQSIVVALLAWCFLKEVLSFYGAFTISISVIGVILTTTPLFIFYPNSIIFQKQALWQDYTYGMMSTLGVCVFVSVTNVIIRHVRGCPASVIIAVQSILSVLFSLIMCLNFGELKFPSTANYWIITILISLLTLNAKLALIFALKYDHAFRITIVLTLSLPGAIVFRGFSQNTDLKLMEIAGLGLIILSIVLLFVETTLRNMFRKYCGIAVRDNYSMELSDTPDEPEEPALKKLLSRAKAPTLYSTD